MQSALSTPGAKRRSAIVIKFRDTAAGLAAGAFACSAIFATVDVGLYWSGFATGVLCTATTLFGAGFGLSYRPTF
jgi:hypothetical protein